MRQASKGQVWRRGLGAQQRHASITALAAVLGARRLGCQETSHRDAAGSSTTAAAGCVGDGASIVGGVFQYHGLCWGQI